MVNDAVALTIHTMTPNDSIGKFLVRREIFKAGVVKFVPAQRLRVNARTGGPRRIRRGLKFNVAAAHRPLVQHMRQGKAKVIQRRKQREAAAKKDKAS